MAPPVAADPAPVPADCQCLPATPTVDAAQCDPCRTADTPS
jgi:hypothetical protein